MKYSYYIWDFDGTLFDSYPHLLACCLRVLSEEQPGTVFDPAEVRRHLQTGFGKMRTFTGMTDEGYRRFDELHHRMGEEELPPSVIPFDDAEAVLSAVVRQGGRNFLYTHRNKTALRYLEQFGLADYFTGAVTAEDGFPSKPAPDAILSLLERYALPPEDCLMAGDRIIDGQAGLNAGIAAALVNAYPPVKEAPPGFICSAASLTELAEAVEIL